MPSRRFLHWQVKHLPGWMKRPLIEIKSSNCIVSGHLQAFAHILNSHNYPIGKQSRVCHRFTEEGKEDREIMTRPKSQNHESQPDLQALAISAALYFQTWTLSSTYSFSLWFSIFCLRNKCSGP